MIPDSNKKRDKKVIWNTKNKNGWKLYKENTERKKDRYQTWKHKDVQKEWEEWMK